ncbi:glycosyltransferase family 2 protein [Sporomusa aerivorans]|uniref:glycosyltransferase family 2 protein n=1 Tax=Sporomusa aerivorans TaxID=204936 RepID=UPI00352A2FF8
MTEISVIILTYNRKHLLPRSIESVLKQSFSNFELLLIDNGSNDGSSEICDQYAQTDKRVRAVHTGGGNIGYGRNVGLDEARGNYITFVDDDDYCEHDMLEFLYNLAVGHQADISICGSTYFFETTQTFAPKYIFDKLLLLDKEQGVFELLERKRYNNATPTKLFSKKLFDEIRFKVSGKFDDIAMTYKIFEKATKTVAYGIPKYSFAKHGNNNSGFIQSNQWMNEQLNEYIIAIEERNAYLKQRLPGLENYLRYSKWSYYLSMCDKFDAFNMNESRSVYDFMMKELENNLDEFSSYVQYHTERDMDLLKKLGGKL